MLKGGKEREVRGRGRQGRSRVETKSGGEGKGEKRRRTTGKWRDTEEGGSSENEREDERFSSRNHSIAKQMLNST